MKRFLTILLTLMVCVSALILTAYAADTAVSVANVSGTAGETVTMDVTLSGNPGVAYMKLKIHYDGTALTLVKAENTGVLQGMFTTSPSIDTNPYVLQWTGATNSTGNGAIAKLTFRVQNGTVGKKLDVHASLEESYSQDFDDVVFTVSDGSVCTHTYGAWTKTDNSSHSRSCSLCGASEKANHSWNAGVITTPATCAAAGQKVYTCTGCNGTKTESIAKTSNHTLVTIPGKAATCTASGLTEGKKCSVCGTATVAQKTIAAKGHTLASIPGKAATCTASGLTEGKKCSVCNTVTLAQKTIAAKGHTPVSIPGKAATCAHIGLTEGQKCSVCGTVTKAQTAIGLKKHSYYGGKCTACGAADKNLTGMYRLYNPYTLEHMFSSSAKEREILLNAGWTLDGLAFYAPSSGAKIYRLYNPAEDWHTYSTKDAEIQQLTAKGWKVDGVMAYSASEAFSLVYKMYNPYERINYWHFCSDTNERDWLVSLGWVYEGIAWYAIR